MPKPSLGKPVPDFERPATGDKTIRLSDFRGKQHVVLYFYPKDDTSGCTTEGKDFTEHYGKLKKKGVAVLGVSRDSISPTRSSRRNTVSPSTCSPTRMRACAGCSTSSG
jgi:thioredoxin-dependent peroxiredoxin